MKMEAGFGMTEFLMKRYGIENALAVTRFAIQTGGISGLTTGCGIYRRDAGLTAGCGMKSSKSSRGELRL